ncbi:hypothetical protein HDA40_008040 [Hamadaea flava]|uniref:DUF2330 domain-containing protein n=1 Tax=Hamadaea flava TaxID=1742688 RepID=A0ABV8LWR6_9ACTN|nr:DUF2330 domain-containing protein [Hamadaea flava]MCP2329533.1 hypothetical protein [Hamadaea flava]
MTVTATARRFVTRFAVVLALGVTMLAADPATSGACACGAFVANDKLYPQRETALVELSGRSESITLSVQTSSQANQAAFLMPVPARARFEIADAKVFAELDEISRPEVKVRRVVVSGDGAGAPPGQSADDVTVVDHVEVGPYEVAQLSGTDASAVSRWLTDNGFTLPEALGGALRPYLAEGWLVVAVRLAPTSGSLSDGLPPMRVAFETESPVYPMRLSATAEFRQPLRLYVLADHRMDMSNPAPKGSAPDLTYADEVTADPQHPTVSALLTGPRFLTRYDAVFNPKQITEDIRLTQSASDEHYRAVVTVTKYVQSPWPMPGVPLLLLALIVLAAVAVAVTMLVRRLKARV